MGETGLNEAVNHFSQLCERRNISVNYMKIMAFHPSERVFCNVEWDAAATNKGVLSIWEVL